MESKKKLCSGQRIRRQTTFKELVERGTFARGEFFYLWVARQSDKEKAERSEKPMIGIIVSRKTDPTAVGRNLWKRRVREIFREHQEKLLSTVMCLVKVRHTQRKPSFSAAKEDLVKLFKKAGACA